MNRPSLEVVQRKLYLLCLSDYSAESFTSGLVAVTDTRSRWQAAVDTLYRLAVCELIWSPSLPDGQGEGEYVLSYIEELSRIDPFPSNDLSDAWLGLDVLATKVAKDWIKKFELIENLGAFSPGLDEVLRERFYEFGVPFDVYPVSRVKLLD
jgi:hypothetical protein